MANGAESPHLRGGGVLQGQEQRTIFPLPKENNHGEEEETRQEKEKPIRAVVFTVVDPKFY